MLIRIRAELFVVVLTVTKYWHLWGRAFPSLEGELVETHGAVYMGNQQLKNKILKILDKDTYVF